MRFFPFLCDAQVDLFYPVNAYFIEGSATNLSLQVFFACLKYSKWEGAPENRGQEGNGRREKKGREAGSIRWWEAGEKFKKASFHYLLMLTSSQRNEPNNVSSLPFNVLRGLTQNFIHKKSQKTKIRIRDKKNALPSVKFETFPSRFHHRS